VEHQQVEPRTAKSRLFSALPHPGSSTNLTAVRAKPIYTNANKMDMGTISQSFFKNPSSVALAAVLDDSPNKMHLPAETKDSANILSDAMKKVKVGENDHTFSEKRKQGTYLGSHVALASTKDNTGTQHI
jgi:hypothetical protein